MKTEFCILAVILLFVMAIILLFLIPATVYKSVPAVCSTVEFNPDMTPEARRKCRELRSTKY
jgi:CHASE3 domain sensor protein